MSMASRGSVSPAPPGLLTDRHRTVKVSVAVDSTDDEDLPADAYLPQRSGGLKHKKQKSNLGVGRRPATSTDVSDTESEDSCYQVYTNERMTPAEAKIKAEEERQKAAGEEAKIKKAVEEQLQREEIEENKRQEEMAAKKKEEDEKKKAIMEGKQKAAAEKTAKLEEKKQAEENKKKAELDAKRKEEQVKKKAETDTKKAKEEEAQKEKDDIATKKKATADAKKEAEQEAKKKEKEEAAKTLAAEEEAKRLVEEEEQKKKDEIAAKKKAETDAKKTTAQKMKEEEANAKAEEEAAKKAADEEAQKKKEDIAAKKRATDQTMKDMEAKAQLEEQEAKRAADEQASVEQKNKLDEIAETKEREKLEKQQKKKVLLEEAAIKQDAQSKQAELEEAQMAHAEVDTGKKTPVDLKKKMAQQTKTEQMKEKLAEPTKEEESIMVDETHQLASKEDLFAAISDTSLKSGKKVRQRRKSKPVEEADDSEEDIPTIKQSYKSRSASKERPKSNIKADQETMMEVETKAPKSRTTSRERPKTLDFESDRDTLTKQLYAQYLNEPEPEEAPQKLVKSRTTSSERPKSIRSREDSLSFEDDEPSQQTIKSRTTSRERPKGLRVMEDSEEEFDEPPPARGMKSRTASNERSKKEDQLVEQPKRGARSRTSSKQEPDHFRGEKADDVNAKPAKMVRQPSGDSRPASRLSDVMSETFADELKWEDEEEDEHMPSLAPMSELMTGGAGSRPDSKTSAQTKSRPGSRALPDLENATATTESKRPRTPLEFLAKIQDFVGSMPMPGSRSSSTVRQELGDPARSRPGSRSLAQEEEILKLANEEESRQSLSRTSSTNKGDKRPKSREHPKELFPDFDDEEFLVEQQQAQLARGARTRAKEGLPGRSRTSSRERPQPLWPEDETDSESQQRRDSSADRSKLVGGGRDDLLKEDMAQGYLSPSIPTGPSPGGYGSYRDEMELDTSQYVAEAGIVDTYHDASERFDEDEDEPPPSEPIFQQSRPSSYHQESDADVSPQQSYLRPEEAAANARSRTSSNEHLRAQEFGGPARSASNTYQDKFHSQIEQENSQSSDIQMKDLARSRTTSREKLKQQRGEEEFYPAQETISSRSASRDGRRVPTSDQGYLQANNQYEDIPSHDAREFNQPTYGFESASEADHEHGKDGGSYTKSGKKVSFAESEQKFHMKPEPEVKQLHGTKLFSFAPSTTHEQPPEIPVPTVVKGNKSTEDAVKDFFDEPKAPDISEHESSTSPRAFLKAMTTGAKGNQPKPKEEKGGSIFDTILRRGRSSSAQGSRNSSRQSSLDRAIKGKDGGSSSSYVSAGSVENVEDVSTVLVCSYTVR